MGFVILVAFLWNSLVAWVFYGVGYVIYSLVEGEWGWRWDWPLIWWGLVLLLGFAKLWKEESE